VNVARSGSALLASLKASLTFWVGEILMTTMDSLWTKQTTAEQPLEMSESQVSQFEMEAEKVPLSCCQIFAVIFNNTIVEYAGSSFVSIMKASKKGHKRVLVKKTR
jgi:hypothetical protein